jgi:hypothetical protein
MILIRGAIAVGETSMARFYASTRAAKMPAAYANIKKLLTSLFFMLFYNA